MKRDMTTGSAMPLECPFLDSFHGSSKSYTGLKQTTQLLHRCWRICRIIIALIKDYAWHDSCNNNER